MAFLYNYCPQKWAYAIVAAAEGTVFVSAIQMINDGLKNSFRKLVRRPASTHLLRYNPQILAHSGNDDFIAAGIILPAE